jgi:ribonuclease P protein component
VFRQGVRRGTPQIRLVLSENDLGYPRLGLAVGRRVGGAVVRNRLKRRLREIFRRHRDVFPAPLDVVVIPLSGAERLSFDQLRDQFLRLVTEWRPRKKRR